MAKKRVSEQSTHYAECEDCNEKFHGDDIGANTMEIEVDGEVIRICFSCRKRRKKEESRGRRQDEMNK